MGQQGLDSAVWTDLEALPPAAVAEIVNTYLDAALGVLTRLRRAIRNADVASARHLIHELRGSSLAVGAMSLAALCAELVDCEAATDREALRTWLPRLEATYGREALALNTRYQILARRALAQDGEAEQQST